MKIGRSRVTTRGLVSIPADVMRRLALAPGSVLEWHDEGSAIMIRRAGRFTFEDIHRAVFPEGKPKPRSLAALDRGLRDHVKARHARR